MNKELMLKIADAIEANPQHFDMSLFQNRCNTTCCIGGWAVFLGGGYDKEKPLADFVGTQHITSHEAATFLDLMPDEAEDLFYGNWFVDEDGDPLPLTLLCDLPREDQARLAADHLRTLVAAS